MARHRCVPDRNDSLLGQDQIDMAEHVYDDDDENEADEETIRWVRQPHLPQPDPLPERLPTYYHPIHPHRLFLMWDQAGECDACLTDLESRMTATLTCPYCNFDLCLSCYTADEIHIPLHRVHLNRHVAKIDDRLDSRRPPTSNNITPRPD